MTEFTVSGVIETDDISDNLPQNVTTIINIGSGISPIGDLPMSANARKEADAGAEILTTFNIQVCSKDGRLLSEYTLTRHDDDVSTLKAAERCACKNLFDHHGESLLVVVTEETLPGLRQSQRLVTPISPAPN
ncbi:MAG: hypothetical protein V3U60_05650 [Gammaproteobacteria bacterium]